MTCPIHHPHDWGREAHDKAVNHLDACDMWQAYYDNEDEEERPAGDDPASAPYCACQTCLVREVLYAAWPVIEEAVRSGDFDSDVEHECTCPPPAGPPELRVIRGAGATDVQTDPRDARGAS